MRADLHVHSTASDGTLSPSELVSLALQRNVDVLAIADHDSVEGLAEAIKAARDTQLVLVPAVELSASHPTADVHILGYHIDHEDPGLLAHLAALREARLARAYAMLERLAAVGIDVDIDEVLTLAEGGAVGRSHVARALVAGGHADHVADAFDRLIGRGKPHYVSKNAQLPAEVIAVIRRAGGVAVVAHPGVSGLDTIVPELIAAGLGGIEAYHADHTPAQREHYANLAREAQLFVTGGSDFHGHDAPNPPLGSVDLPDDAVTALLSWRRVRG